MAKWFGILTLLVCCGINIHAQEVVYASDSSKVYQPDTVMLHAAPRKLQPAKAPKVIMHELCFGFRMATNGWSIYTDLGKVKTGDQKRADIFHNLLYYQLEFTEKKDPKEQKIPSPVTNRFGGSSSYKYGKINCLYAVKIGVGYQKLIAGKPDTGCVSIHWANTIGFALGLLKPYYLNVESDPHTIKFSDATQEHFLDQNSIDGYAGFSKGLNELTFVPGGHIRSAINFDFSTNKHNIIGVQVGVNAEFYSQKMQLMASSLPPRSAYYDMFVAFQFGKRW